MNDISKDALLALYQQRMDKCTTEQFWMVAAISALNAGVISDIPEKLSIWVVFLGLTTATLYGIYFVRDRHITYYAYRKDLSDLVSDCTFAPKFLKENRKPWKISNISGVGFYMVWIAGGYIAALCVLLKSC